MRDRGLENLFDLGLPGVKGVIDGVHHAVIDGGIAPI